MRLYSHCMPWLCIWGNFISLIWSPYWFQPEKWEIVNIHFLGERRERTIVRQWRGLKNLETYPISQIWEIASQGRCHQIIAMRFKNSLRLKLKSRSINLLRSGWRVLPPRSTVLATSWPRFRLMLCSSPMGRIRDSIQYTLNPHKNLHENLHETQIWKRDIYQLLIPMEFLTF